jgi:hypothetical protein
MFSLRKKYICPVCGFLLKYPAANFNICPSCGVEFGADDIDHDIGELQQLWFDRGMVWSSPVLPRPVDYNPALLLKNLEASSSASSDASRNIEVTQFQVSVSENSFRFFSNNSVGFATLSRLG